MDESSFNESGTPTSGVELVAILERLPKKAWLRIDADLASLMAEFFTQMEAASDVRALVAVFSKLVAKHFETHAREVLEVIVDLEEFETALHRDIPVALYYKFGSPSWVTKDLKIELTAGLSMYATETPPWADVPADNDNDWYVGATLGKSIRDAALRVRAEAYRRVAEKWPAESAATQDAPSAANKVPAESHNVRELPIQSEQVGNSASRKSRLQAYKDECLQRRGLKVTDVMVAKAANPRWNDRTPVDRWKRNDPRCTTAEDAMISAVLTKKPHLS